MATSTANPLSLPAEYRFSAFQVAPAGEIYEQEFLSVVSSVACGSSHPLLRRIIEVAEKNNVRVCEVVGFQEFPDQGSGGAVEISRGVYRALVMGTRKFVGECGLAVPDILEATVRKWEKDSMVVFGGWDGWVRGILKFNRI